jgi:hypothetical protein
MVVLLLGGCAGRSTGVVEGTFRLPGRPAADLRRAGLNFSRSAHGSAHGDTTRVGADGRYTVTLAPGSYSVVGALSGDPGGPAPETCAARMNVVVTAHKTTRANFVCHATPVSPPKR